MRLAPVNNLFQICKKMSFNLIHPNFGIGELCRFDFLYILVGGNANEKYLLKVRSRNLKGGPENSKVHSIIIVTLHL